MMRIILAAALLFLSRAADVYAGADTVYVKVPQVPVLVDRKDNVLCYVKVCSEGEFSGLSLELGGDTEYIDCVRLYSSGVLAPELEGRGVWAPQEYVSCRRGSAAYRSYSVPLDSCSRPGGAVTLAADVPLGAGEHCFWVSVRLDRDTPPDAYFTVGRVTPFVDGKEAPVRMFPGEGVRLRPGVTVRTEGDDGVAAYRIPGLVTAGDGTLVAVYDVRYNSSVDLQEHIDVGSSRSRDGGRTWEPMRIVMSFSGHGGLPDSQNGVGDPCVLYDPASGDILVAAAWTHGMGGRRAWNNSRQGNEVGRTGQLVIARSSDGGISWSEPHNVTPMVKDSSWHFMLQGPGRGMVMDDGTLVFPVQFIDSLRMPSASIMYSRDGGRSWSVGTAARSNTTESQAVQLSDGSIMLNMRDNRGGSRAVCVTSDMGRSWQEHPSSRKALSEPVCMASLLRVKAGDNVLGRDLMLFSNPASQTHRRDMTVRLSLDGGHTWPQEQTVLLDEGYGWGYSCLTMVDSDTVGILYESSAGHLVFQTVGLEELCGE